MPKGEIIEFPGRKFDRSSDQNMVEDNTEFAKHLDVVRLVEMLEYLTALRKSSGPPKPENIELRRVSLVMPASDEELFTIVNKSASGDWQASPTYYDAIIAELRKRNLIPSFRK
jgi:hypothetical protein